MIALACLSCGWMAGPARAATGDSTVTRHAIDAPASKAGLFGRRDAGFALAAASLVALAAHNDRFLTEETTESGSSGERRLARAVEPFGNPAYLLPGLAAIYGAARLLDHPDGASSTLRIGASVVVAGAATGFLKEAVGRSRPSEDPDHADRVRPFSGHFSFPSGHATIAFAAATAIDRETTSRWVPWAVYPAAALIGWSRVHDRHHWTSDVVAGATLGAWTALKTETLLRDRAARHSALGLELVPDAGAMALGLAYRF